MVLLLENNCAGPSCKFTDSDMFLYLDLVSNLNRVSRKDISGYLGIGEGSVRTLTEMLRDGGFIEVRQTGIFLRPPATELLMALGIRTVDMSAGKYVIGEYQFGTVICDAAEKVFNGIDQRNAGLRMGGDGCTTWVCNQGSILMLPDWNVDENDPQLSKKIRDKAKLGDGDVLIIGGGSSKRLAMISAVAAALDLV